MNSNKELMQRRSQAIPRGVGQIHPIFADRAENCRVWDVEGREYLDFAGGIAVLNTGHLHPKVVAAVEAQLKKLSHTCRRDSMLSKTCLRYRQEDITYFSSL